MKRSPVVRILLAVAIGAAAWMAVILTAPYDRANRLDFFSFYAAAKLLCTHPHDMYSLAVQWGAQQAAGGQQFQPWAHPAPEALVFVPLTFLSCAHAFDAWVAISICLVLLSAYLLRDDLRRLTPSGCYALMVFAGGLILKALWSGQDFGLILLLWVFVWRALKAESDFVAGLLIGLALIRYQFALPMLFFFFTLRRWRMLAGATISGLAIVGASFAIVGPGLPSSYLRLLRYLAQYDDAAGTGFMSSIRGFAALLFPSHAALAAAVGIAGVLAWGIVAIRRVDSLRMTFAFAMVISLLVDPHAFNYELAILSIPMILLLRDHAEPQAVAWSYFVLAFATQFTQAAILPLFCPVLIAWAVWIQRTGRSLNVGLQCV